MKHTLPTLSITLYTMSKNAWTSRQMPPSIRLNQSAAKVPHIILPLHLIAPYTTRFPEF